MTIQDPAKAVPVSCRKRRAIIRVSHFYDVFVRTYFVGCYLLKMKVFILKIRRMLTLFVICKQGRDLNYQSRSQLAFCTHLLIYSVSLAIAIKNKTKHQNKRVTSVIFRNYLYLFRCFWGTHNFSECVEKSWKVELQEPQHKSERTQRILQGREEKSKISCLSVGLGT